MPFANFPVFADDAALASALGHGFAITLALIVAIGAQNAFVLRQGLRREQVGPIVAFCILADLALIGAGVAGMSQMLAGRPALAQALAAGGALFLAAYGLRSLWSARHPSTLRAATGQGSGLTVAAAIGQTAAVTLLNPHAYLDTIVLIGSVGAQQAGAGKLWFVAGAALASTTWFVSLGFGARKLAPMFARERAWQVLDALIGVTMLVLAGLLAQMAWQGG